MNIHIDVQLDARATRRQPPPGRLAGGGTHVGELHACLSPLGHLAEGGWLAS